jgi:predicted  nucleic acid-binding Zn-ribbon protein
MSNAPDTILRPILDKVNDPDMKRNLEKVIDAIEDQYRTLLDEIKRLEDKIDGYHP